MTRLVLPAAILTAMLLSLGCGDDDATGNNNQNENLVPGTCGDGTVNSGEACDDGSANSDTQPDACRSDCRQAYCGDGVLDSGEECDEGGANSDLIPNACRRSCLLPHCGDGVVEPTEECDDQNADAGDGCAPDCTVESRYQCTGSPSLCTCGTYRSGADCGQCWVYADVTADPQAADGTSWETAFSDLKQAVDAADMAGAPCDVWVAQGRYVVFETSPIDSLPMRSGIGVYGGFSGTEATRAERDWEAHRTVIDGTLGLMGVSSSHVVTALSTQDATLDGFVVTRGFALGTSLDAMAGGLLAMDASLEVANCVFVGNYAEAAAGGIGSYASDLRIRNVMFTLNVTGAAGTTGSAGGALAAFASQIDVADSYFVGNFAVEGLGGGGAHLVASLADFRNVVFAGNGTDDGGLLSQGNTGGAIKVEEGSTVTVRHATLAGNHAYRGGALLVDGSSALHVISSLMYDNVAATGTNPTLRALLFSTYTIDYSLLPVGDLTCATCVADQPGFAAIPLVTGDVVVATYDPDTGLSEVEIDNVSWTPGELAGLYVSVPSQAPNWAYIVDNTANTVSLWGDLTTLLQPGIPYVGHSLRLSSASPCVDAAHGLEVPPLDVEGVSRWDKPGTDAYPCAGQPDCVPFADIGAYEYHP